MSHLGDENETMSYRYVPMWTAQLRTATTQKLVRVTAHCWWARNMEQTLRRVVWQFREKLNMYCHITQQLHSWHLSQKTEMHVHSESACKYLQRYGTSRKPETTPCPSVDEQ